ncbi:MAG: DUF4837 family protein [Bacteroidales bacterium]|nr:DUF4837 family protein [Bacteroidales bacterium]
MKKTLSLLAGLAAIILTGCSGNDKAPKTLLPNISGKAGEVFVVIEKDYWQGKPGNDLREVLAADCPHLPQREPLYTLVNVSPAGFGKLFKVHRNIILYNVDPQVQKSGIVFKTDVWAAPQCVIQISAPTADSADVIFTKNADLVVSALEQAERDRVISNTMHYEERSLANQVLEFLGDGTMHFPNGYSLKKKTDDFIWIGDEKQFTNQGVFIYKYPVEGNDPFTEEKIIAKRNEVLQNNVPGMFEGTYMITSDFDTPSVKFVKYKGRTFAETRGLWEVHNDYMGGPFVSHSFYSKDGKSIIVLECFVYAPKYDKRQYLRQVESLLYSFGWKE